MAEIITNRKPQNIPTKEIIEYYNSGDYAECPDKDVKNAFLDEIKARYLKYRGATMKNPYVKKYEVELLDILKENGYSEKTSDAVKKKKTTLPIKRVCDNCGVYIEEKKTGKHCNKCKAPSF